MHTQQDFWILSLSGGGYRGLFTATVLEELERALGVPLAQRFDLITGTSIGGIMALALAAEVPTTRLTTLFTTHGSSIFRSRRKASSTLLGKLRFGDQWLRAKYDATPLRKLLSAPDLLGELHIRDLQHRVLIPTVNFTKGSAQLFKTPHHPRFWRDREHALVDIALATSAAPSYFPIHAFDGQCYLDGGLVANSPAFLAVLEAKHFLGCVNSSRIHVLSIGTMNSRCTNDETVGLDRGLLWSQPSGKGWREKLFDVTIGAQEVLLDDMLKLEIADRFHEVNETAGNDAANNIGLDKVTSAATRTLIGVGKAVAQRCLTDELIQRLRHHRPEEPKFYHHPPDTVQQKEFANAV